MEKMGKYPSLFLVLILAMSALFMVKPIDAQTTPKPSVPVFSLKLADHSYDTPITTTTTTNPYTGEQETHTQGGYHIENKTIDIYITNQYFASSTESNGNQVNIHYYLRVKGHFGGESDWKELYSPYSLRQREGVYYTDKISPTQSNTQYTILSIPADYPSNSQIDIQVQALEGYFTQYYPYAGIGAYGWRFIGESSGWSNTQTIKISDDSVTVSTSPTPNPTPTASVPELPILVILPLLVVVPLIITIIAKKRNHLKAYN
jgi:hypothetical protein